MNSTYLLHRPAGETPVPSDPATRLAADVQEPPRAAQKGRERRSEPRWARLALIALLLGTAIAYMWGLSASGYANSFYAAAVQAGAESGEARFFGAIDS